MSRLFLSTLLSTLVLALLGDIQAQNPPADIKPLPPIPSVPRTPLPRTTPPLLAPPAAPTSPAVPAAPTEPAPATPTETAPAPTPVPGGAAPNYPAPANEEYYPYGYGYDRKKYHAGSTMERLRSTHSYRQGMGYQPDSGGDPSLFYEEGSYSSGGNYPNPVGAPYHWGRGGGYGGGNPYEVHFGPGVYRSGEAGHLRFPYYSYRRPWYYPGPAVYVRDTNLHW